MRYVKIFKSIESELWNMEQEINDWVKETGNRIVDVSGNIAPQSSGATSMGTFSASDVLIVVTYEKPE